jgi:hypothetical protein
VRIDKAVSTKSRSEIFFAGGLDREFAKMLDGQISWAEAARTMAPCAEVTQSIGVAHNGQSKFEAGCIAARSQSARL